MHMHLSSGFGEFIAHVVRGEAKHVGHDMLSVKFYAHMCDVTDLVAAGGTAEVANPAVGSCMDANPWPVLHGCMAGSWPPVMQLDQLVGATHTEVPCLASPDSRQSETACYGSGFLFGFLLGFPLGDPGPLCFGSLFGFLWIPVGLHWIFLWFVLSDKVSSGCVWPPMANAFTSFTLRMVIHI